MCEAIKHNTTLTLLDLQVCPWTLCGWVHASK